MTTTQWYRWDGTILELRIQAQTQNRNEGLGDVVGNALRVRINASPIEGQANKRLLALLAEEFGVAKSRVSLVHGARSRQKWIRIERPERVPENLAKRLGQAGPSG